MATVEPQLDLSSCDREPIHIPGSIQPHGFLLALDPETLRVREASANAGGYLGLALSAIFGRTLAELLGRPGARLHSDLAADSSVASPRLLASIGLEAGGAQDWEVVAHRTGLDPAGGTLDRIVVEFEHTLEPVDTEAINARLYNFISANRGNLEAQTVMQAAVTELRALTGCDRVVLYSFDEQGHGLVLAEDRGEQFASYLGLRFPASDVPRQARRMYELNRVRIIPNVDYEPSPLLSDGERGDRVTELDLSWSILRSVSPVHRAYMRNMGTVCSMSVSILIDGKLWGLVSCHHHEPRYVPLRLRAACDFVMQVVGSQIESQQNREHLRRVLHGRAMQSRLLAAMAASERYMDGLLQNPGLLMDLLHADGAAVVVGGTIHLFGITPAEAEVRGLIGWLGESVGEDVFVSSRLSERYPAAAEFAAAASGVIAASLSKISGTQVLWFRQEQVATVRWAGDPHKPGVAESSQPLAPGVTVNPRHSFEEWQQTVRGCSAPWTPEEIAAAAEFRSAVLEIVLKRAEELAQLAAGLKVANEELEAFSYSVSHDLRAPFRHISGFSEMLREEEAGRMSEKGQRYLATIMNSARFAGLLVDSLLDFSRIARTRLQVMPVDMEQLVDREWASVLADDGQGRSIKFSRGQLPRLEGDPHLLGLVMRNLLSNAVKYTGKVEQAIIHVDCVDARAEGQEVIFSVKDNGAGFDQQYAGKLFGVFQRLHRAEDFEGTGIGLANVRRIVARHGGRTWAEGEVGRGATFFFSLPGALSRGESA
jgi:light-regulated signal transduction histidine kinase (bacteriophytochrome)